MICVVDFNMIVEINQILRKNNIAYSVHSIGGCASCGLHLHQDGEDYPIDQILVIINDYLKGKFMKVVPEDCDPLSLHVESNFA